MQLKGIIKLINDTQNISDKFTKREFVITDSATQYPQDISFQCTQDRCTLLDKFSKGETVNVHFNIRGREWTSPQGEVKYFNTLEAWKIDSEASSNNEAKAKQQAAAVFENPARIDGNKDDLPF